jgi:hypothetical protein
MRIFMLGWEFPPHISGGLGTACFGMTRGLDEIGVSVCFVLPTAIPPSAAGRIELRGAESLLGEAGKASKADPPKGVFVHGGAGGHYTGDMMGQVHRYARLAGPGGTTRAT